MPQYSAKRRKRNREADKVRKLYSREFPFCQVPGCKRVAIGIHEISRGPARNASLDNLAAFLRLCFDHHLEIGNYAIWPIARQLALKKSVDQANYDRVAVNLLRCENSPEAITEAEVDLYLPDFEVTNGIQGNGFMFEKSGG